VAKYKLLSPHFSEEDKLLETDTEVGDGTPHLWTRRPTPQMEALDEGARKALEREMIRARENNIPWIPGRLEPIDELPMTMAETDAKYEKEVAEAVAETEEIAAMAPRQPTPAERRVAASIADRIRR
jgi:hypothetical protein